MRRFVSAFYFCVLFLPTLLLHAQDFTTLVNFDGSNGYGPSGALAQSQDGNLYGVTAAGGEFGFGTLYQVTPAGVVNSGPSFNSNTGSPVGTLLPQPNLWGFLYGATSGDNSGTGWLYMGGLPSLTEWNNLCAGCHPEAGLTLYIDQSLYGTSATGGQGACPQGCGFIFRGYGTSTWFSLYQFSGSDGSNPHGELLLASDGNFYGTTLNGGIGNCQNGCGTIFKITPNGDFTSLYKFCSLDDCPDGANPYGALVQGSDGALYGTTSVGGNLGVNCWMAGCGTIFRITLDGALTTLYTFCDDYFCPTGANPQSGLVLATDGSFYGTASGGGDVTLGTAFRITPQGQLTLLHTFTGDDGAYPTNALLQARDGQFYGVTSEGGSAYGGTVFRMDIDFNAVLSVNKFGNGTVTSDDSKIQCGNVCSANYESADVVKLTATPDQQWAFVSWEGCDGVQDNVCTVTMNHARTVTPTFLPLYPLSVSATGNGTVTSNDGYISCGQGCSHTYVAFTSVVLTAAPAQGWVLAGWTGCDRSNGNVCSLTMNNPRNVSATFKALYPLTVSNSGNGLVIGNGGIYCGSTCSASYPDGATVTLTGLPNAGYTIGWSGCDNVQGNVCTLAMSRSRSVTATFTQGMVTLSSLLLRPSSLKGGTLAIGTVTLLHAAPPGGVGIAISSDHPEVAHPPSQVVVPGGQTSLSFAVKTFVVHVETVVTLTASAGASHVNATLKVEPPNWRGQETLAGNGSLTEAAIAELELPAELSASAGARSPSPDQDVRPPQAVALTPPPADPADERKQYQVRFIGAIDRVGEYNGDLRDLPQVPSVETPEHELVQPADRVHTVFPAVPPANTIMASLAPMPQPVISFPGMSYTDGGIGHPPDTTGAAGPLYYVQAINKVFGIFHKSTGVWASIFGEGQLWTIQASQACEMNPNGDPIVLYDPTADRWIFANLGYADPDAGPFYECIAVSKNGDPLFGGWWLYAVQTDQPPVPATTFNDYPKFGIWNDGCLYMGADGFLGNSYSGQVILSASLSDMYSGNPLRYSLSFLSGSANFALFPATMLGQGSNLPPPSEAEYYVQESQTGDAFNVRTIAPGSCVSGGTMSAAVAVPHDTYNAFPQNIVPQPPPATQANLLDTIENVLMQWVQYRKVGSSESLWVNHTTYVTNSNTSPQWAQIDVTGGNINTALVQQQIFRPDASLFRWMGSLGVDSFGDMALCYSTSNATAPNYPSIQCAGRLATDPLGQLLQGETEYIAGNGSQVSTCGNGPCHRWGDYSSMTIDPIDDCTFWYTNMFYPDQTTGNWGYYSTQVIAFRYPNCVTPPITLTVSNSGSGSITSADGYINCGSTCSHNYDLYSSVSLAAYPAPGWVFSSWSGCDSPLDNLCNFIIYRSRSLTANFTRGTYTLSVSDVGTGSGSVASNDGYINCGSTCSHDYLGGTAVTLTATPGPGSRFDGWSGCDNVQNNVCTVSVTRIQTVMASFNLRGTYRLAIQKLGSGTGAVTSGDGHINCGAACYYDYTPGDSVTLTAEVDHGSELDGWVGCDQVQNNTCSVKMAEVRNVTAKINLATYVLAVNESGNGTISSGDGHLNCGTTCSYGYQAWSNIVLTAVPGQGWTLAGWSGCDRSDASSCTVTMNNPRTVGATFKALYPLTVSNSGNGLVIGNGGIYCGTTCSESYPDGATVTLTGTPNPGYTMSWSGCDQVQANVCTVGMSSARSVTATFTQVSVTLRSLAFQPSYVKGGQLSLGTLTLSGPAPPGGVSVALTSDHPGAAHPPSYVVVPGGKTSVQFAVNTYPVKSNTMVRITATAGSSQVSGTLMVGTTSLPPSLK